MSLNDLFSGKYILAFADGTPAAWGGLGPVPATKPEEVMYLETIDKARELKYKFSIHNLSYHRVEGLRVLQEKFSY